MSLGPGSTIGPFKIHSLLGKGGMGEVFSALDTRLDRKVALKILPADFASDTARLRRFQSEAKTLASISHPNILVIHEVGTDNGNPYLVSEFLEGRTLREELSSGALPLRRSLDYALQIAHGLAAAHARGIIHRDLKPENIFITKDARVKILDFGLAKLASNPHPEFGASIANSPPSSEAPTLLQSTIPGLILGTPAYMSPEQVRGKPADQRSDLFAFGCVFYEMLGGFSPFRRNTAVETMSSVLNEEPRDLSTTGADLPVPIVQIIERCLHKDASERFQSANDLSFALAQQTAAHRSRSSSASRLLAVILILAFAAGIALALLKARAPSEKITTAPPNQSIAPSSPAQKSVAVLPFANLSADRSDEYLSDGMTEELLNALGKIKELRVPGRSSTFSFKGKSNDDLYTKVAEQLKVDTVLEGSVRKAGDKLRISAHLVSLVDGSQLWSETYDGNMTNVFGIQSQIASRVAQALQVRLLGTARSRQPTSNLEAYKLYLQARSLWNRRTGETILRAVDYFNQALALDPAFALASSGLADCYEVLEEYAGIPASEAEPKARAAALKAIELDPTLGEPHAALGNYAGYYERDWAKAEAEFKQSITLNPNYATAHHWYSILLNTQGRTEKAVAEAQHAKDLDPLSPVLSVNLAKNLSFAGQPARAIALLEEQIALTPEFPGAHFMLGDIRLREASFKEAMPHLEKAQQLAPEYMLVMGRRGYAFAHLGRTAEAEAVLNQLEHLQAQGRETSMDRALVAHALGRDDEALALLERAVEVRSFADELSYYPWWNDLRPHPRAQLLLRRMNLLK